MKARRELSLQYQTQKLKANKESTECEKQEKQESRKLTERKSAELEAKEKMKMKMKSELEAKEKEKMKADILLQRKTNERLQNQKIVADIRDLYAPKINQLDQFSYRSDVLSRHERLILRIKEG